MVPVRASKPISAEVLPSPRRGGSARTALAERVWGGADGSVWEHFILGEEMWAAGEPRGAQYMNVNWIGPTLMRFGTRRAEAALHLPKMAAGARDLVPGIFGAVRRVRPCRLAHPRRARRRRLRRSTAPRSGRLTPRWRITASCSRALAAAQGKEGIASSSSDVRRPASRSARFRALSATATFTRSSSTNVAWFPAHACWARRERPGRSSAIRSPTSASASRATSLPRGPSAAWSTN